MVMAEDAEKAMTNYVISLDHVDLDLLSKLSGQKVLNDNTVPLWNNAFNKEYFEFEVLVPNSTVDSDSASTTDTESDSDIDNEDSTSIYCGICKVNFPEFFSKEHRNSQRHQCNQAITREVLNRLTYYIDHDTQESKGFLKNTYFCDVCNLTLHCKHLQKHGNTEKHKDSREFDEVLKIFTDFYINGEDVIINERDTDVKSSEIKGQIKNTIAKKITAINNTNACVFNKTDNCILKNNVCINNQNFNYKRKHLYPVSKTKEKINYDGSNFKSITKSHNEGAQNIGENKNTFFCTICNVNVPNSIRNIKQHLESYKHVSKNKDYDDDEEYNCYICKEVLSKRDVLKHFDKQHSILTQTKKNTKLKNKTNDSNKIILKSDNTDVNNYSVIREESNNFNEENLIDLGTINIGTIISDCCIQEQENSLTGNKIEPVAKNKANKHKDNTFEAIKSAVNTQNDIQERKHRSGVINEVSEPVSTTKSRKTLIFCEVCNIDVLNIDLKRHISERKHRKRLETSQLDEIEDSKEKTHYLMHNNDRMSVKCKICEIDVQKHDIQEHLTSIVHKEKYGAILRTNKLEKFGDKYNCKICEVFLPEKTEIDHIVGKKHKTLFTKAKLFKTNENVGKVIKDEFNWNANEIIDDSIKDTSNNISNVGMDPIRYARETDKRNETSIEDTQLNSELIVNNYIPELYDRDELHNDHETKLDVEFGFEINTDIMEKQFVPENCLPGANSGCINIEKKGHYDDVNVEHKSVAENSQLKAKNICNIDVVVFDDKDTKVVSNVNIQESKNSSAMAKEISELASTTESKKANTFCKICNKDILDVDMVAHTTGKKHLKRLKTSGYGVIDEPKENILYFVRNIDQNNMAIECKICKNEVQKLHLREHLSSNDHKERYEEFLLTNKLEKLKTLKNEYYCHICEVFVSITTEIDHVAGKKHKLTFAKSRLDESNDSHETTIQNREEDVSNVQFRTSSDDIILTSNANNDLMEVTAEIKVIDRKKIEKGNESVQFRAESIVEEPLSIDPRNRDKLQLHPDLKKAEIDFEAYIEVLKKETVPKNDLVVSNANFVYIEIEGLFEIVVPYNNFHGFVRVTPDILQCRLCRLFIEADIIKHKFSLQHMQMLSLRINGKGYRMLDESSVHCVVCNMTFQKKHTDNHSDSREHRANRQAAYIIQENCSSDNQMDAS